MLIGREIQDFADFATSEKLMGDRPVVQSPFQQTAPSVQAAKAAPQAAAEMDLAEMFRGNKAKSGNPIQSVPTMGERFFGRKAVL